jgi:hypothetical protein
MAEQRETQTLDIPAGIRRDGTLLDGKNYTDGQWVRFQRNRPKKMGGYVRVTDQLSGPVRDCLVWSRENLNAIYSFSPYGIENVLVDNNGLGSLVIDRTPSGFTYNAEAVWSTDSQYDDAAGSQGTVILAHAASSLTNIDSTATSKPYLGLASGTGVFTQITDAPSVSGGVFSCPPYTFVHGSDGYVAWSDANQPQVWAGSSGNIGDAGADRVTGAKIVKGMALRASSGPAVLLWSLDSVLRGDWVGGGAIFRFSHLSVQSSILSQNSVIEYDGAFFWVGIDRFMACDGGKVQELPNQMNINWFFDNLNFAQRQKVWAMKVPRYGEIVWFFPYGSATECTHAVIFNVIEKTWYDYRCSRAAGFYSQVFHYPVMADSAPSSVRVALTLGTVTGTISVGDSIVGVDSSNVATVNEKSGSIYTVTVTSGDTEFVVGENINDATSGATSSITAIKPLYSIYVHEKGRDAINGDSVTAIESYFETPDFGLPSGGTQNAQNGANNWTRLVRLEPDFLQEGEMTLQVIGRQFANSPDTPSLSYNFTSETEAIDMREQHRQLRLRFTSNVVGGHYEMGRPLLHTQPGDLRS